MAKGSRNNRYVVVSYDSPEHALSALKAAQNGFIRRSAKSKDLSRVENNTVILDSSAYCSGASCVGLTTFLKEQEGALPKS